MFAVRKVAQTVFNAQKRNMGSHAGQAPKKLVKVKHWPWTMMVVPFALVIGGTVYNEITAE